MAAKWPHSVEKSECRSRWQNRSDDRPRHPSLCWLFRDVREYKSTQRQAAVYFDIGCPTACLNSNSV